MFNRWFLDHPRSVGESYFEHQRMAFGFSANLFSAAFACLIHGIVPCLFKKTASTKVIQLSNRMSGRGVTDPAPSHGRSAETPAIPAAYANGDHAN